MSFSTWYSHSPCVTCFLNLAQGLCAIQMELPNLFCSVLKRQSLLLYRNKVAFVCPGVEGDSIPLCGKSSVEISCIQHQNCVKFGG